MVSVKAFVGCELLKNLEPIFDKEAVVLDTPKTGSAIKRIRLALQISQKALAIEMGVSQTFLADLEAARRKWSFKRFDCAREALERLTK